MAFRMAPRPAGASKSAGGAWPTSRQWPATRPSDCHSFQVKRPLVLPGRPNLPGHSYATRCPNRRDRARVPEQTVGLGRPRRGPAKPPSTATPRCGRDQVANPLGERHPAALSSTPAWRCCPGRRQRRGPALREKVDANLPRRLRRLFRPPQQLPASVDRPPPQQPAAQGYRRQFPRRQAAPLPKPRCARVTARTR